jgi:hypothetical protein
MINPWWAHLGSNQGPTGYEPVALPTELWAQNKIHQYIMSRCLLNNNLSRKILSDSLMVFSLYETFQLSASAGVSQFSQSLGLYLSYTLPCYTKITANFF